DRGARQDRDRVVDAVDARRVAARPGGVRQRGADAAVAPDDAAAGRLADDRAFDGARVRAVEKGAHARAAALLVAGEQHAEVARGVAARQRFENGGDRALGVGTAEADQAVAVLLRGERVRR